MPIRIQRNDDGNCITFVGSSNPAYFNACLSAEVDSFDNTRVNVINDIHSTPGKTEYEFYNIIYTEWRDADNNPFPNAQAVADYITLNGNVSTGTNVNAEYEGVWDAATNTPDITQVTPVAGSWFYISVEGDIDPNTGATSSPTVLYKVNDIVKYNATGSQWQKVPNETVRVDELEQEVSQIVAKINGGAVTTLLSTNPNVYADGAAGGADPEGVSAGWHFKNTEDLTEKINWYYWGNTNPALPATTTNVTGNFAVVNLRSGTAPYFVFYTQRQFNGGDAASWYRSRYVYITYADLSANIGDDVLIYWGDDPGILPLLPRVELTLDSFSSNGPQGAGEIVMFGALSTSTNYPAGTYDFVVNQIGNVINNETSTYLLINQEAGSPIANGYSDTHYVTLDATNDYIELTTPGVEIDFNKSWTVAISIDSVSPINDSSYITLLKSGGNSVNLRKGGTNWGIYVSTPTGNVWQANTWHAPVAGSKIIIRCNGGISMKYYLHNAHDGGMWIAGGGFNSTYLAGNDPEANKIEIGKGGNLISAYFTAGYWFGGLNNCVVWDDYISDEMLAEYLTSDNVTEHSYYAADVVDMITLGEGTYPACNGLKGAITGQLINGTPEDFVER